MLVPTWWHCLSETADAGAHLVALPELAGTGQQFTALLAVSCCLLAATIWTDSVQKEVRWVLKGRACESTACKELCLQAFKLL